VVIELDGRRPYDAPAGGPKPDTEVDIVESDGELLVESFRARENIALNGEASGGYTGQILFEAGSPEISADLRDSL
jgi:hypothetical protein